MGTEQENLQRIEAPHTSSEEAHLGKEEETKHRSWFYYLFNLLGGEETTALEQKSAQI